MEVSATVDLSEYLKAITTETDALAGLVETHPSLGVPSCPGWTLAELGRHLGNTQRWAATIVAAPEIGRQPLPQETPGQTQIGDWLRAGADQVVAALHRAGPDKPVWTMGQPRTAWFWYRRLAQETTLHRWDAEEAVGIAPSPIPSDLAADGVSELLEMFVPGLHRRAGVPGSGETFHLHRTDGPGEWLVRFGPEGATVTEEHAKGDVALRGAAEDLLLALWRRRPTSTLEVFGSPEVLARWTDLVPAI